MLSQRDSAIGRAIVAHRKGAAGASVLCVLCLLLWWAWPASSNGFSVNAQNNASLAAPAPLLDLAADEAAETMLGVVAQPDLAVRAQVTATGELDPAPEPTRAARTGLNAFVLSQPLTTSLALTNSAPISQGAALTEASSITTAASITEERALAVEEGLSAATPMVASIISETLPGSEPLAGSASISDAIALDAIAREMIAEATAESRGIFLADETPTPVASRVPQVVILPGIGGRAASFPAVEPTTAPSPTPTPIPLPLEPGRIWSNFTPAADGSSDHFWIGRAFPPGTDTQIASPSYQFGSTAGRRYRVHHGVDIGNPLGTPVLAAVEGEVVYASWDEPTALGPYTSFYGNTVVIKLSRPLPVAGGNLDVFLLYGHLSEIYVEVGQQVERDNVVGAVGMTGIAIGPHLHVEVRLGANTYSHNVNPYLWMEPLGNTGAVAVRVLTADGRTWPGAIVSLLSLSSGWGRQIVTYMDVENIGPDPMWGENGAMDAVPPGRYVVATLINGERVSAEIDVAAGRTSFVELRTAQ